MKEINQADPRLMEYLKKQPVKEDAVYRRSRFTLVFEENQHRYILNTMTRQCLECDTPPDERYSGGEIMADPVLRELAEQYFFVPEEWDETVFFLNTFRLLQAYARKRQPWLFTIFPTMNCNARCVYCFEEGAEPVTMSEETVRQTVAFIADHPHQEEIALAWFGGEPLMKPEIIDRICEGLAERGVRFRSQLTTNGSLVTEEILRKMTGLWNLRSVQVSVDGDEPSYIRRKRYPGYSDEYHRVLRAVGRMAECGLWVNVRCNVDQDNVDTADKLIRDLAAAVPVKEKVMVCFGVLNQARNSERDLEVWQKAVGLWSRVTDAGFKLSRYVGPYTEFRCFHCMADQGNIVITPDGKLYPCEYYPEESCFGNVKDGIIRPEARAEFITSGRLREKCRLCPYLPDCTPFAACPIRDRHCRELREFLFVSLMKGLIRRQYTLCRSPEIGAYIAGNPSR